MTRLVDKSGAMLRLPGALLALIFAATASAQDEGGRSHGAWSGKNQPRAASRTATPADQNVTERYEGRLTSSDVGFNLKLYRDGKAAATWTSKVGSDSKYSGTYTGTDGNYSVKLTRDEPGADASRLPSSLDMTMRATGGMVAARYRMAGEPWRDASSLRLMEVDAGDVKLNGKRAGAGATSTNRRNGPSRSRGESRQNRAGRSAYRRLLRKR